MVERRVVLVVDGHAGRRADLARLLANTPHAVVHAEDSSDAITRLKEAKPDLVCVAAEDMAAARQTLALLSVPARTQGAMVYVTDPRQRQDWDEADGVLPLPLTVAALDEVWREFTTRHAAAFAASAMELSLDAMPGAMDALPPPVDEPTSLSGPDDVDAVAAQVHALDVQEPTVNLPGSDDAERTPPEGVPSAVIEDALVAEEPVPPAPEPAAPRDDAVRTNVGDIPDGLEDIRRAGAATADEPAPQDSAPPAEEDVFASGPAEPPPTARPPEDTDAVQPAPALETPPAPFPTPPAFTPPRPPTMVAAARASVVPNAAAPRVVRLDAAPLARLLELSSSPLASRPGTRILDEEVLGQDLTQKLLDIHRALEATHHHGLLGVPLDAPDADITQAFRTLSSEFHPDRHLLVTQPVLKDCLRTVYQRLSEAYRVLHDPALRTAYEDLLAGRVPAPPAPDPEVPPISPEEETYKADAPLEDAGAFADSPSDAEESAFAAPAVPERRDTAPQFPVLPSVDAPVRPALAPNATPATRAAAAPLPPKPVVRTRHPTGGTFVGLPPSTPPPPPPPAPSAPADLGPLGDDAATTAGGKKFVRLAAQALLRNDLNGARLNLTFALGYEPENTQLKRRLTDIEGRMSRGPSSR